MDVKVALCEVTLLCSMFAQVVTQSGDTVLRCYDCQNTFKHTWDPYTPCQVNATAVPVATCLQTDRYCKTERWTIKGITIRMARSCAGDCYYGCVLYRFGVTELRCTSCCNHSLCNTGSAATAGSVVMTPTARLWRTRRALVWALLLMMQGTSRMM